MYATTTQYHVDIMFTFLMADLRPIGSQISGLQFEGSQLTGIYLERVPFDGSHSAEKKTGRYRWIETDSFFEKKGRKHLEALYNLYNCVLTQVLWLCHQSLDT